MKNLSKNQDLIMSTVGNKFAKQAFYDAISNIRQVIFHMESLKFKFDERKRSVLEGIFKDRYTELGEDLEELEAFMEHVERKEKEMQTRISVPIQWDDLEEGQTYTMLCSKDVNENGVVLNQRDKLDALLVKKAIDKSGYCVRIDDTELWLSQKEICFVKKETT
jgi:hypothetical protein